MQRVMERRTSATTLLVDDRNSDLHAYPESSSQNYRMKGKPGTSVNLISDAPALEELSMAHVFLFFQAKYCSS